MERDGEMGKNTSNTIAIHPTGSTASSKNYVILCYISDILLFL